MVSVGVEKDSSTISLAQVLRTCPSHNLRSHDNIPGHDDKPPSRDRPRQSRVCAALLFHTNPSTICRFLLNNASRPAADDDAAEGSTSHTGHLVDPVADTDSNPGGRKKLTRQQKKAHRGANKGRRFGKVRDELELCWRVANGTLCEYGSEYVHPPSRAHACRRCTFRCRFTHDIHAYLAVKPRDIKLPLASSITNTPPFVVTDTNGESAPGSSLDFNTLCPYFEEAGECRLGLKCRFLGAHARVDDSGAVMLITDEDKKSGVAPSNAELNLISAEILKLLRQNKVSP